MAKIDAFFNLMMEVGASDLHLASGSQPIVRVRGDLERINHAALENDAPAIIWTTMNRTATATISTTVRIAQAICSPWTLSAHCLHIYASP